MTKRTRFLSAAAAVLTAIASTPHASLAQAGQDHKQHHLEAAPANGSQAVPVPNSKGAGHSANQKGGMMGGMMGGQMMGDMMHGTGRDADNGCPSMMGMLTGDPATRVNGRVAFLKAELAISDAQSKVWASYAAALQKNLENMHASRMTMAGNMSAQSPVDRLDKHLATMESRLAALKEMRPALADLYAALSDTQKKTADQLLTGMGCMM